MTTWQSPTFIEIYMNAEIGAYQPEPDDEREQPPRAAAQPTASNAVETADSP